MAEDMVAETLCRRGFSILGRRVRTKAGEIDLIAANATSLVFVEVKARKSFHEAAYAVVPRQQTRLLEAASLVLATHQEWHREETRFDVALVCGGRIRHLEDAIRA